MITLLVDSALRIPVSDPIQQILKLECEVRFNEPGFGTCTLAASPEILDAVQPGCRMTVIRDGVYWMSGRIERPGRLRRAVSGQYAGQGIVEYTWTDGLGELAGRITYPDPALAATDTSQPARWIAASAPAGTIMRNLVDVNAGQSALSSRRIPTLTVAASTLGSTVSAYSTRFEPINDELRKLAILGGGLGFRVDNGTGTSTVFTVYQPRDLTAEIRFSFGMRNLIEYDYDPAAPTLTTAIIGGEGEGADRVIASVEDAAAIASWWRIERFIDQRGTTDPVELTAAGNEAIAEGAETAALTCTVIDTPDQSFGLDKSFWLGDKVSLELATGLQLDDVVRAGTLTFSPREKERVKVLVGTVDASSDPIWVRSTRNLARRLGRLEARR